MTGPDRPVLGYVVTERRNGEVLLGDDFRGGMLTTIAAARSALAPFQTPAFAGCDMVLVELREVASTGSTS